MMTPLDLPPVARTARVAGPTLTVDLDAVRSNTRLFAERTPGTLIAVVKADGYGHGASLVARAALESGASYLGVTSIEEALALRADGIRSRILSWLNHPTDADYGRAAREGIDIAVPDLAHLRSVAATPGRTRVHLSLDTGMARDGAEPSTWIELCRAARAAEVAGSVRVVGVMGHLPDAEDRGAPSNSLGRDLFEWGVDVARLTGLRPRMLHLAATAATLTLPGTLFTATRVGAGLVGIDPSRSTALAQPLTLTAPLIVTRTVRRGTSVGYGHDWTAERTTRLGLVPLGYADGLPRSASGRAEVLVAGRRRPVVGRMSMDQLVVDLGDAPAGSGDTVTVFGPGDAGEPTLRDWADQAGTIEHEIVTRIGSRVHRRVTGAASAMAAAGPVASARTGVAA